MCYLNSITTYVYDLGCEAVMSQTPQNVNTSSSRASNETTTTPMTSTTTPETSWRPASSDVGWEYEICVDPTKKNVVNCTLCHKRVSTCGITRLKEHIAGVKGNVAPCKKAKDEDKAKCRQLSTLRRE